MTHFALEAGEAARLLDAAKGTRPADLLIVGGRVANVYSGELYPANVAVSGGRVAYVGPRKDFVGTKTRVLNVRGKVLAPGYVEPHAHPWVIYNPATFAEEVVRRGTTTVVYDNLFFFQLCPTEGFDRILEDLSGAPLSLFWTARSISQTTDPDELGRFTARRIDRLLRNPAFVAQAEVTRWPDVWEGKPGVLRGITTALRLGKPVDGHTAGASYDRINAMTAAGLSSCHEAITAEETLMRLRMGLYVMLRHSSLRPDLRSLTGIFKNPGLSTARIMMTTDGPSPVHMLKEGFSEGLYRLCLEEGIPPLEILRMLTLTPATYYRQDQTFGGIAPGRLADILVLDSLEEPFPRRVFARGREVARDGRLLVRFPRFRWRQYGFDAIPRSARGVTPDIFGMTAGGPEATFPVLRMINGVISRREDVTLPVTRGRADVSGVPGLVHVAWIDRHRTRVVNALMRGYVDAVEGFASSFNTALGVLVMGRDRKAMSQAARRVFRLGGGIALSERGNLAFEFSLPIGGMMSAAPFSKVAREMTRLSRMLEARGFRHGDLLYSLLFMVSDFLPDLKITPVGIYDVKTKSVLRPPERIG
ncbi:MAG: adenine deaminase C-terminal domain-containing protein [Nitrospinota bacterium]